MHVYENPFRRATKRLKEDYEALKNKSKSDGIKKEERWIEDDKATFKLPEVKTDKSKEKGVSSQLLNDYY